MTVPAVVKPEDDSDMVELPCLFCKKPLWWPSDSNEAWGVFNPFCPTGECEDRYAATL